MASVSDSQSPGSGIATVPGDLMTVVWRFSLAMERGCPLAFGLAQPRR